MISTALFIIGSFSIVVSNNFILFIISRISIGFLVTNGNAIILSYIGDIISYENRGKFVFIVTAVVVLPLPFAKIQMLYIFMFLFSLNFDSSWPAFQLISSEIVPKRKSTYMSMLGGVMAVTNIFAAFVGQYMYSFGGLKIMSITVSVLFVVAIAIFSITTKKHANRFSQ